MQGHVENTRPWVPLTPQGPTRWGCDASRAEVRPQSGTGSAGGETWLLPARGGFAAPTSSSPPGSRHFPPSRDSGRTSSPSFDKADVSEGEGATAGFFQLLGWVTRPVTNHQQRTLGRRKLSRTARKRSGGWVFEVALSGSRSGFKVAGSQASLRLTSVVTSSHERESFPPKSPSAAA